jgi:hypothetical protein
MNLPRLLRCFCPVLLLAGAACGPPDPDDAVKNAQKDVRQLLDVATAFSEKHDGKFPALLPQLVEEKLLPKVPSFHRSDGADVGYLYIAGHAHSDAGGTLLLATPPDTKSSKRCIGLIDGTVKIVDGTEADKLIDQSARSLRPK